MTNMIDNSIMNLKKTVGRALVLALFFCLPLIAAAQGKHLTGRVIDGSGVSVIGAYVLVEGTNNGVISDLDGDFTLDGVTGDVVLKVSCIGYVSREIPVGNGQNSPLVITLDEDSTVLDDAVVVGYGVQKKSDLTGSIGSVNNSKLTSKGTSTVMESLQGQVAGVDISQSSSRAGESFSIAIRGKSTLGSSTQPLFVVDGIISNDINFLNPFDIEKIDILKDASSTAIYGSRATNGVVIVTTRQAKTGDDRVSVSYDGYVGYKTAARMPDFMDPDEWLEYRYMRYATPVGKAKIIDGRLPLELTATNMKACWNKNAPKMKEQFINQDYTDWVDLMLKDGIQQNHFVQASGTGKKTSYRIGAGYQQEDGVMGDSMKRYNIKLSVDGKISQTITAGASANLVAYEYDYGSKKAVQTSFRSNGFWLPYNTATGELNYMPGKDLAPGQEKSKAYPAGFTSTVSPIMDAMNSEDKTLGYKALASLYLQWRPVEEVIFKTSFYPTMNTSRRGEYYGGLTEMQSGTYNAKTNPTGDAKATVTRNENFSYTWDTQLNYVKDFGRDHSLNAMALMSVYSYEEERYKLSANNVAAGTMWYNLASAADGYSNVGSSYGKSTMLSYALRANYSYKGRYLATLSTRWDGSSKFQSRHRWGMFPSAALAWRIGEEPFVKNSLPWLDDLKLRLSYGMTGNNASVGNYETVFLADQLYWSSFGKGYGPGVANELLSWETTAEMNAGLDFSFLSGRLSGSLDLYSKTSDNLLMDMKLLCEQGTHSGNMTANVGKVNNRGVELMLKGVLLQTRNLYWDVTLSFAKNHNEILELQGKKEDMRAERWFIGQPIDVAFDLRQTGICTREKALEKVTIGGVTKTNAEWYGYFEGCMTYEDFNNDGKINDDDRQILGHAMPDWTGSLSTSFSWKNWDLSVTMNTRQGSLVYSPFMEEFTNYSDRGRTKLNMDFYIPEGAPVFNYSWDGSDPQSLVSDPKVRAEHTTVGSYPYPFDGAAYNYGGGNGWYTGKNKEFQSNCYVDGSYVKIKTMTLGYTVPQSFAEKIKIGGLRIYVNVLNPFTFTSYQGFDPEWADAGISDGKGGPSSITCQLGINLKF